MFFKKFNNKESVTDIEYLAQTISDSGYLQLKSRLLSDVEFLGEEKGKVQLVKYYYFEGYRNFYNKEEVEAITDLLTGLNLLDEENSRYLYFRYNLRISQSYARLAYYTSAKSFYSKALKYYKISENALLKLEGDLTAEKILLYNSMGHCYLGCQYYAEAEQCYLKCEEIGRAKAYDKKVIKAMQDRGRIYHKVGKLIEGENLTYKALHLSDSMGYAKGTLYSLISLAEMKGTKNEFQRAILLSKRAYKEAQKIGNERVMFLADREAASVYKNMGNNALAAKYYERSLTIGSKDIDYQYRVDILRSLSHIYIEMNKFDKASCLQNEYIELNDSITTANYEKNVKYAESIYEQEAVMFKNRLLNNENKLKKSELMKSRLINISACIIMLLLGILTYIQFKAKYRYKKYSKRIKEQNDIISEQNREIILKNLDLNEYKNNLERVVEERTTELKDALHLAEESNRLKSAFLQNISHEIRTPVNAIYGFSQLIRGQSEETVKENINIVLKSSRDLLNTVDKILEVSKNEAGNSNLTLQLYTCFDFNEQISSFIARYTSNINYNGNVALQLDLTYFEGEIVTDLQKVLRIISYLVDNAFKFTDNGWVRVETRSNKSSIDIIVQDTGIGIAEDELKGIFDLFHKVETPQRLTRGVGLGLVIVNRLVNALYGNVRVKSIKGKGSTFNVTIPKQYLRKRN